MRHLLLLGLLACASPADAPAPRDPHAPEPYRVLRGDTWATIASKRSTTPEKLSSWNGMTADDLLVPGQILSVYRDGRGETPLPEEPQAVAAAAPAPPGPAARTAPTATTAPTAAAAATRVAAAPHPRVAVARPGMAMLSLLDDVGGDEAMVAAAAITSDHGRRAPGTAGLPTRTSGPDVGPVETVAVARPTGPRPVQGPAAPKAAPTPRLTKASPKTCLPVRLDDPGEDGMIAAEGLGRDAIVSGMRPVTAALGACVADGRGEWPLTLEVVVGCDGMVYGVTVTDDGGIGADVAACVVDVVRQGSFAAAAAATTFLFPVRLRR